MSRSELAILAVAPKAGTFSAEKWRKKIDHITIHHMGAVMTAKKCGEELSKRGVSAHYGIGSDGVIASYAPEEQVAWANGNWESNQSSVSIETSNSKVGGDYPVSEKSYELLIKLVADVAKRNGLGELKVGKNLFGHRDKCATVCPGDYLYSRLGDIAKRANEINAEKPVEKPVEKPAAKPASTKVPASFFPARGYFKLGDTHANIGKMAEFMFKTFPSYTNVKAKGNYFGRYFQASVKEFQRRAKAAGHYNDVVDGYVGPKTVAAMTKYGFKA